jgi:hypothetical protein
MILTIVALPRQAYGDTATARKLFEEVAPRFQTIPGLRTKYFVRGAQSGGVYIWADRAAAESYFTPAWAARMEQSYGAAPDVTYLDVPCVVDNDGGTIAFPD